MSLNLLLTSLMVLIRHLPALADYLRRALRWGLVMSYRIYSNVLNHMAIVLQPIVGIDLLSSLPRTLFALAVSTLAGIGLHHMLGLALHLGTLLPFALHGLLVGWLWDELLEPGGIRLGERL